MGVTTALVAQILNLSRHHLNLFGREQLANTVDIFYFSFVLAFDDIWYFSSHLPFEIFFSPGFLKVPLSVQVPCKKAETLSISEEKGFYSRVFTVYPNSLDKPEVRDLKEGELKECHQNNDIEVREVQLSKLCPHTCALPACLLALTEPRTIGWVAESSPQLSSCPQHTGPCCLLASSARRKKVTSASL